MMKKILLLVDGSSIGSRSFYVENPFEFFNMVARAIRDTQATHVAFSFDNGKPDQRLKIYPEYKAHRREVEDNEDRRAYIDKIRNSLNDAGFITISHTEGDDVLGTLARMAKEEEFHVIILSGDSDLLALVDDKVKVLWYGRNFSDRRLYDVNGVKAKLGVPPHLVYDLIALTGEKSDNIPGIHGIGPVNAKKMIRELGNLQEVLEHGPQVFTRFKKQLVEERELAEISYDLVRIRTDLPILLGFSSCKLNEIPLFKSAVESLRERFKNESNGSG